MVEVIRTNFWSDVVLARLKNKNFRSPLQKMTTLIELNLNHAGHFFAAKVQGMKVQSYNIGYGPKLISFNDSADTEFALRAFPLGKYVREEKHSTLIHLLACIIQRES